MYYKKSRRKLAKRRMAIILIAVIAAAAVLAVYFCFFSEYRINKPALQKLPLNVPENVVSTDSGIVYLQDSSLSLMNFEGEPVWSLPVDSASTSFIASNAIISTYGAKSAQFFTYDKQQLFSTSLGSDIVSVRCGKNSIAILTAAQTETGEQNSYIYLYDLAGQNVGQIDLKDRQIIDYGVYGDSDMIWTLSIDTSGAVPVSYIATFKQDGTMTGSIDINTQIVEKVDITSDAIFASGTNSLISYTYFGEKNDDTLIYGWQPYDASMVASSLKMLYRTRTSETGSIGSVKLLDETLSEIMIYFPQKIFTAVVNQNGVYAFSNYNIYVYTNKGQLSKTIELESPIQSAKKISDRYVILWDAISSYLYKLN